MIPRAARFFLLQRSKEIGWNYTIKYSFIELLLNKPWDLSTKPKNPAKVAFVNHQLNITDVKVKNFRALIDLILNRWNFVYRSTSWRRWQISRNTWQLLTKIEKRMELPTILPHHATSYHHQKSQERNFQEAHFNQVASSLFHQARKFFSVS